MDKYKDIIAIALFLVLVIALWIGIIMIPSPHIVEMHNENFISGNINEVNLLGADFNNNVFIPNWFWLSYPEEFFTPEDLQRDDIPSPVHPDTIDFTVVQYATHVTILRLPPEKTYGIHVSTADYSMRLFINGTLVDEVGVPGTSPETTIPRTLPRIYFFTPMTDTTTIVVHSANFVHINGAYTPRIVIGESGVIARHIDRETAISFLIMGCLIGTCLYHLSIFILNRKRLINLIFSGCCLFFAFLTRSIVPIFAPDSYNWHIVFRLEYLNFYLVFMLILCFLDKLLPGVFHRIIVRGYYIFSGLMIISLALPTTVFTRLFFYFQVITIALIIYVIIILICLVFRKRNTKTTLAFAGILITALFGLSDILVLVFHIWVFPFLYTVTDTVTPLGKLFFVFCYSLILAIDYNEAELRSIDAERQVLESEARVKELLKNAKPVHALPEDYGLSKREQDVLWLLLDGKSRKEVAYSADISISTVNTYCTRIFKKTGVNSTTGLYSLFGLPQIKTEE